MISLCGLACLFLAALVLNQVLCYCVCVSLYLSSSVLYCLFSLTALTQRWPQYNNSSSEGKKKAEGELRKLCQRRGLAETELWQYGCFSFSFSLTVVLPCFQQTTSHTQREESLYRECKHCTGSGKHIIFTSFLGCIPLFNPTFLHKYLLL